MNTLKRIHRFLLTEAFYPLVFATLIALGVFAVRVYWSGNSNYSNLVWNLALAWIPYGISLGAAVAQRVLGRSVWFFLGLLPVAVAWLLFFPNAPYIVTDFYHLTPRPGLPLWFDIGLISLFAFSGCFLAVASLRTMQNIFRTLKAGSAASLIRNSDFSAPNVRFLGVLPSDVKKYDLPHYNVKETDPAEARALKKAKDALEIDSFFKDKKNKNLSDVLRWLIKEKIRCEQQSYFSVDPKDPIKTEKIILEKIRKGDYI